jgi:hypothetical protein
VTSTRSVLPALLFAPLAIAQSAADRAAATPSAQAPGLLDRALGLVLPIPADAPARPEHFREYLLSIGGPVPLVGEAAGAGIGQWLNSPEEWGQGWNAYGKRFGSNLAYNAIRQTITYGGSHLFEEDTRYFASGKTGFRARAAHALLSTFTARHADGRDSFSISGTAGVIGASAISSVWGPPSWKTPGNIAENAGISFAATAAGNFVREFLPDVFRRRK